MKSLLIIFIVTSHAILGNTGEPTGLWIEELATPYYKFVDAGYKVKIVSVNGGEIPIDPRSQKAIGENPEAVDSFLKDKDAIAAINNSPSIEDIKTDDFAAVFFSGGHGTMWDFPNNKKIAEIISSSLEDGKVVAAVCHGPVALVGVENKNGEPIVKGKKVTGFSNEEEKAVGLTETIPFSLESKLKELGAEVETADNFQPFAIVDGNLITGQNPASSEKVADLVIERLGE